MIAPEVPTGASHAPLTALIADDEPALARALAQQLAQAWPELQIVGIARNGVDAAAAIAEHSPTLAFLDIQMPGLSGLEVAQGIEGPTEVVFVTAYDEYAVQAFENEALDYLLKPVTSARLDRTVERLKRSLVKPAAAPDAHLLAALQRLLPVAGSAARPTASGTAERLRYIRASAGDLVHQVAVEDVLFFHADDKYTCVRLAGGIEHLIRTPIAELAQQLDPEQFWQIHRSTLINLKHLAGTRRDENSRLFVRVKGHQAELPVSRAYVHLFKAM